jgi:hypothetical protein
VGRRQKKIEHCLSWLGKMVFAETIPTRQRKGNADYYLTIS